MLSLILLLLAGSAFAYLSKENWTPVTVHLGSYIFSDIPLFYIIIGSLVIGLVLSYILQLVHAFSTARKLRKKQGQINKTKDEVLELTKRVHQLELENEKLKHSSPKIEPEDPNAL